VEFEERIKEIEFSLFKGMEQVYVYCNAVFIDAKRTLELFRENEEGLKVAKEALKVKDKF